MTASRAFVRHLPALLAVLAIGAGYAIVADRLLLGPRGLVPGLLLALVTLLSTALGGGQWRLARALGLAILAVVTLTEVISTSLLVGGLLTAEQPMAEEARGVALALFRDAALLWLVNILTFALWYWEIDGGGPMRRHHAGYRGSDFVFPQAERVAAGAAPWVPHFVDYLFLAFNTSTAFSPTDTLVVSIRGKLLMMTQSLISLTVLAILAARAINTL